jgi:hypothetical protein
MFGGRNPLSTTAAADGLLKCCRYASLPIIMWLPAAGPDRRDWDEEDVGFGLVEGGTSCTEDWLSLSVYGVS